jgi:hypothetical protein
MVTSYGDAMKFYLNYNQMERYQFHKLSGFQQFCQLFTDCIVYIVALVLNVHDETKIRKNDTHHEYDTFVQEHSIIPYNKNVIVIFTIELDIPVSIEGYKELENNFTIIFHKISGSDEIIHFLNQVKQESNNIKALWIRAHGSPTTIAFNEYDYNMLYCGSEVCRQLSIPLDFNAVVILECCFTGDTSKTENIAHYIASCSRGRNVYAPSREMVSIDKTVRFSKQNGWNVIMEGIRASPYSGFLGRLHALWLMKKFVKENITMAIMYH